jgi:RHS repeat-associated protein
LQTGNIKKTIDLGEVRLGENATDIANNIKNHTYTSNITANDDLYIHTEYVDPTAQGADFSNTDIINKIKRTWTTSDYAGVNKLKEIVFTYDTHGRVHTEKTWIDKNKDGPVNSYTAVSEFDYDAYSNLNYTKGKAGIETTTNYDTNYRMFPVKKTTGTFVTESTFDVNSGLPLTTKDAMSIKLQNVYDVFYRLTDVYVGTEPEAEPSLWITHIEYNHGGIVSGLSQNYIHQKFNGYEAYIYNDGLGRVIQSRVNALDTETANDYRVTDTKYNARGNVEFTTTPFFSNGSAFTPWVSSRPGVLTEYDCLGRAWKTTPSDDDGDDSPLGPSTVEYKDGTNPWAKVVTDPEGKVTKSYFDSAGRVINLIEVIDPGDDIQTTYEYDRLGRLITITDNSNNEFTAEYDSLGRKIRSLDPDMGEWTYAYDDSDRLTEQEDAKGNVVKLYYNDELGRLSKKEVYDSSPQLVNTITFTYDSSGGDPDYTVYKGLAYKVEDSQGWIKASYDTRGRAVKTTRHIAENNKSYTTYSSYDDAGRVRQINYPNDEAVIVYNYGNGGELREVRSIQGTDGEVVFYQPTTFDEAGKLLGIDYGNGVKTRYEYYTNTKRLMNIHTYKDDPVTGTQLQDLTYTFDKVSNITRLVDNLYTGTPSSGLGTAENKIQYDDLHRLTSLYSVAEDRTITYGYDALGNITSNEELPSGQQSYGYLENGCTKPHAVTSAAGKTYDYDTCGNMTTRGNQTLVYDARNRLIRVYDGSGLDVSYGYAYDGTRLWKKDNGTGEITQLWIGDIYEEKNGKVLCHVYAGSQLVATFEPLSYWARIINDTPVLAQLADFTGGLYIILLGEGRAPFSIVGMSVLVGLGFGLFYSRKRLLVVYGIPCYGRTDAVYKRNPYRQIIIFTVMATVFLSTIPNEAFATATYDPVFYYYHSDHLGSSQIMTDSSGELVQHYAYKPYGNERWKDNDAAFSVTNRYTSQQIDEDTGLYYYGARYYDPQIGRFIQPDSIIPDASSQGLNRYAYCYNNPLIFTDPSGNDAFSFVGDFFSNVGDFVGGAISWGFSAITDFWEAAYATLSNAWGVIGAGWGAGQVNAVGANIGSAASWAPVPAETGGDPMIGARAAGSTRGIAACCNIIPLPFVFPDIGGQNFTALVYSALIGAFAGGVTAEMFGGSFAQGAVYGAAAGYVLTECLIQMERGSVYTGNPPPIPDMDFERLAAFAEAWLVGGREPTQAEIYNFRNIFPCLGSDFWVTHETTGYPRQNPNSYNCIAFSLGYSENNPRWVNPLPTYQAMDKLYRSYGFTVSDESRANVALYGFYYWKEEMLMGVPEHAAVRIGGGWYESKLGADIQIIHRLGALEGPLYGFVGARFYEKK